MNSTATGTTASIQVTCRDNSSTSPKSTLHVADLATDQAYIERYPQTVAAVELGGVRTFLSVPMLKEGELIGAFALGTPTQRKLHPAPPSAQQRPALGDAPRGYRKLTDPQFLTAREPRAPTAIPLRWLEIPLPTRSAGKLQCSRQAQARPPAASASAGRR